MAYGPVKTSVGGGGRVKHARWARRTEVKVAAKHGRRREDKRAASDRQRRAEWGD